MEVFHEHSCIASMEEGEEVSAVFYFTTAFFFLATAPRNSMWRITTRHCPRRSRLILSWVMELIF